LPLRVAYSLSWDEVGELLGRKVTAAGSERELFDRLSLSFTDQNGESFALVGCGEDGVDVSSASSSKAFSLTDGNNGLTLAFDVFLSDANTADGQKSPRLIDGKLTVPDGKQDGSISGSLWLAGRSAGGSSESGGGGGGCELGFGSFAFLCSLGAGAFALRRTRRP
jgi:hypothetical protein